MKLVSVIVLVAVIQICSLSGESILNFPRLSFEQNTITGIAIVNPTIQSATVTFTAFGADGKPVSAGNFQNPAQITVPANQQVAKLVTEIFAGSLSPDFVGWFQATCPVDGLTGFFLHLDGSDTFFDGADLPGTAEKI